MDNRFVHLHLHSEYSLQDSTVRLKPLIEQTRERGMGAIALTDVMIDSPAIAGAIAVQSLTNAPITASDRIMVSLIARSVPLEDRSPVYRIEPLDGLLRITAPQGLRLWRAGPGGAEITGALAANDEGYEIDLSRVGGAMWLELR